MPLGALDPVSTTNSDQRRASHLNFSKHRSCGSPGRPSNAYYLARFRTVGSKDKRSIHLLPVRFLRLFDPNRGYPTPSL